MLIERMYRNRLTAELSVCLICLFAYFGFVCLHFSLVYLHSSAITRTAYLSNWFALREKR